MTYFGVTTFWGPCSLGGFEKFMTWRYCIMFCEAVDWGCLSVFWSWVKLDIPKHQVTMFSSHGMDRGSQFHFKYEQTSPFHESWLCELLKAFKIVRQYNKKKSQQSSLNDSLNLAYCNIYSHWDSETTWNFFFKIGLYNFKNVGCQ